jgi:hypothetical protein
VTGSSVTNKSIGPLRNQCLDSDLRVVQSAVLIAVTFNRTSATPLFDCGDSFIDSPGNQQIITEVSCSNPLTFMASKSSNLKATLC